MDAIEIFFAAYGILLALALAKLLSGAVRLVPHRGAIRIGWATPLLMLLLVFDLSSFLAGAWSTMGTADSSLRLVFSCLLAAGAYYVAASMTVPETLTESSDLDAWFKDHKRFTVGGILVGNVLGVEVVEMLIKGPAEMLASRWTGFSAVMNLIFYALVLVLFSVRNRVTELLMLATLNALYLVVLLVF